MLKHVACQTTYKIIYEGIKTSLKFIFTFGYFLTSFRLTGLLIRLQLRHIQRKAKRGSIVNTLKMAQKIAAQIKKNIGYYSDEKPTISEGENCHIITWEAGPFEWPTNDNHGLYEEMINSGFPCEYVHKPYWVASKGCHVEPVNGYQIAVYKD